MAPGQAAPNESDTAAINRLTRWIAALQYSDPALPSFGALKIHHDVAAIGADGTRYFRVSPYVSNLGALGLLRVRQSENLAIAQRWINWYFAHLDTKSASDGVPYEHFYHADGDGETTCIKPDNAALCRYNDATDSAAATFFCVLWAAHQAGVSDEFFTTAGRKAQIETLATVLLKLQQPDGLCWAKSDYRVKYLEDNSEVFAGLRDLAALEKTVFHDEERARIYSEAAARVRDGILHELYDAKTQLYHVAKFEDGKLHAPNLDVWYADTQAQMWPHLWGVVAPNEARTQAVVKALNEHWNGKNRPDWSAAPGAANNGFIEAGVAHAVLLAGDTARVQTYLAAIKRQQFGENPQNPFAWPFSLADAGWLLASLVKTSTQ